MANCVFAFEGTKCQAVAEKGQSYCKDHLIALTEHFIREAVFDAIVEHIGTERSQITLNSYFFDELGADSLDVVELVMCFEELFGFEMNGEMAERILSVSDAVEVIRDHLLSADAYLVSMPDVSRAIQAIKSKADASNRQIAKIVDSPFFRDIFGGFGLDGHVMARIFRGHLGGAWIEHVTTVPEFQDNMPSVAHIFFLTKRRLFYYRLRRSSVTSLTAPLGTTQLVATYATNEHGAIKSIRTSVTAEGYDPARFDGTNLEFSFNEEHGVEEAMKFIDKYLSFR